MAKFLTTIGIQYHIEELIKSTKKELVLVTPYLKLSQNYFERISYAAEKKGIKITLIYGKSELQKDEMQRLKSLNNIQIYFCQNLHAKCYHNESSMIITSMNLYEYSEKNREMGIMIKKDEDQDIFNETLDEIESIKNASTLEKGLNISNEINVESEKSTKVNSVNKFALDPNFMTQADFHLPALTKILKEKYPKKEIVFNETIQIVDFPFSGITLQVNGRIDLKFSEKFDYESIKRRNYNLEKGLPGIRFFWNRYQLNIYTEERFKVEINESGLKIKVDKYLKIIDHICKKLTV